MRVLQITPRMAPHIGGVETHVREVAGRLTALGVETEVLTTDHLGGLPELELIDGVPIRRVPAHAGENLFAPAVLGAVEPGRWDLVHVQCVHTFVAPFAMLAARRAGVPYVLTFHAGGHTSGWRNAARRPQLGALRPLLSRAAALVAIADFEVERYARMLRLPRERFVTIPNGFELPRPSAGVARSQAPLIVSCGRLERYKGHHLVLAALPHVLAEHPEARLWIAGRGPEESALREQASRLGVGERVEIGAVSDRQEMADRLAGASLAVMLSSFETQPLAALEAASLGVPLLVAGNSGLAELADKGLARAVARDAGAQAHGLAISGQLRDPLVPGEVDLPSWDDCAGRLADLYGTVGSRRGCEAVPA
jgi:glycosyltransferase involved in cell wall biosynthesis